MWVHYHFKWLNMTFNNKLSSSRSSVNSIWNFWSTVPFSKLLSPDDFWNCSILDFGKIQRMCRILCYISSKDFCRETWILRLGVILSILNQVRWEIAARRVHQKFVNSWTENFAFYILCLQYLNYLIYNACSVNICLVTATTTPL